MKIPQLRILITSFCGRKCIYCRPTGEGIGNEAFKYNDIDRILKVAVIYKKYGGTDIKLTGGDPVFWNDIVDCVEQLKHSIGIQKVELITRSPDILNKIGRLIDGGLDVLNFSLDTTENEKYKKIVGSDDFSSYIATIKECARMNIVCKINTVVMKGITDGSIDSVISFCESNGIKQLKLLDIIEDLHESEIGNNDNALAKFYIPLSFISDKLKGVAVKSNIVYQGGLGHPMNSYILPSGLEVLLKDSENGAWYNNICKPCPHFPCHDALMALRFSTDNKLQFCLLSENNCIDLDDLTDKEIEVQFVKALSFYENAHFVSTIQNGDSICTKQ
jgi:cyclic pyranopterin phosphate synthase